MRATDIRDRIAFRANLIELSGDDDAVWIKYAETGSWKHPRHGTVTISTDDLALMFSNYKSGVHPLTPVELPIDYDHLSTSEDRKPGDGLAAGWVKDLELRANGRELWGKIEWTPPAKQKIRNKEYRYFSPTFHPVGFRGTVGPTILGGAITNYPTLPNCVLTCSLDSGVDDVVAVRTSVPSHEGHTMKIKGKNSKGEEVEIEIEDTAISLDMISGVPAVKELQAKIPDQQNTTVVPKAEFETLNNTVKTLSATVDSLKTQNVDLQKQADDAKVREVEIELDALIRGGKMLPAEKDVFKELAATSRPMFDKMVSARKAAAPIVVLDTNHGGGGTGDGHKGAVATFEAKVKELRTADPKMTYADAIKSVSVDNPQLAQDYRTELSLPVGKGGVLMLGSGR